MSSVEPLCMELTQLAHGVCETLGQFKRRLEQSWPGRILELRVFGSVARGEATPESDLDVFVLVDERDTSIDDAIRDLAYELTYEHGSPYPISPRIMSRAHFQELLRLERRLALDIVNEGILL